MQLVELCLNTTYSNLYMEHFEKQALSTAPITHRIFGIATC